LTQDIEALASDSKLNALGALLSQISQAEIPSRRICVLTEFVATLYYVYADIESRGVACQLVHGEMSAEERIRSLQFFSEAGGVLLATTAVMTAGVSLREVTDLVVYDLPRN